MASIERLTPQTQARNGAHDAVKATFCTFHDGGRRYLRIDTCGRPGRKRAGVASQSVQFDEASALALPNIIERELQLG